MKPVIKSQNILISMANMMLFDTCAVDLHFALD